MKIRLSACIAAGLLPLVSVAALAEPAATVESPKVINKPAEAAEKPSEAKAAAVTVKAETAAEAKAAPKSDVMAEPKAVAKSEAKTEPKAAAAAADARSTDNAADTGEKTVAKTVAPPPKPTPSIVIAVDLTRQRMTVTEEGADKYSWPISSGRAGYYTPTGNFRPQWMAKMWRSRKYDDAPMPNSIFFTGGFAIHATFATGMLGRPASHGCVRLAPANAATLFKMVQSRGMDRTKITVFGAPRHSEPAVARRDDGGRQRLVADNMAPRGVQQRVAYGYGQPVRYAVQQPQKNIFQTIFGSNQPEPAVVRQRMMPQQVRYQQVQQRPRYVYTQDGRLVRIR